ncbi:MAG: sulfotransferase [Anaerolineae bacterium]|jgi:hypothetical protein|nr:sulfotransferase [Anaerolineae bacterium]MBT7782289.1 sulfotransferase [Anaerolineae bacterium]
MIENPSVKNGLLRKKPLHLQVWWALHRLTYLWRKSPDFLIVGVMKGGTTSLFRYLSKHPQVLPPFRKEIKYFDCNYFKGASWYQAHFPLKKKFRGGSKLTGEATPYYIFHPTAPDRIASAMPQAKIIILLRNPINRAYSHYQHMVRVGREPLSFEEAIAAEPERLLDEAEKISTGARYPTYRHLQYSYLGRGEYLAQIKKWHDLFSKEKVLILQSEDLYQNTAETVQKAQEFLGISAWHPENAYGVFKEGSYQPMQATTRDKLAAHFKIQNEALYDYLGRDFSWE